MSSPLPLRVTAVSHESAHVLSIRLEPETGTLPPFLPGQHLPLRLDLPGRPLATYTISSDPDDRSHYRISVKLEPEGLGGSRHIHGLQPGDRLLAEAPRGRFTLDDGDRPVLLLTGGIGITPALSMAHALARQPHRPVIFLHACRNRAELSFAAELSALCAAAPNLSLHCVLAEGSAQDRAAGHGTGLIDRALLRRLLPQDAWQVYLCGPVPFMEAMRAALTSLGLPDTEIRQEIFGAPAPRKTIPPEPRRDPTGAQVHFALSGLTVDWDGTQDSLLELAETHGLTPDFSCRAGICGSCACRKSAGQVRYTEEPIDPPEDGEVLLCCSVPEGKVTLQL